MKTSEQLQLRAPSFLYGAVEQHVGFDAMSVTLLGGHVGEADFSGMLRGGGGKSEALA
jgi:hypothetical protein